MKKFMKNRVLPFVCALSILVSLCVVPVSADFDHAFADSGSVLNWEARINSPAASIIDVLAEKMQVEAVYTRTFWGFVDRAVAPYVGSISMGELQAICSSYNQTFNQPLGETFFEQIFRGSADIYSNSIAGLFLGNMSLNFEIQKHPSSGFYRIKETTTDLWVVTSVGSYPYAEIVGDGETEAGDRWIGEVTAQDRAKGGAVAMHTLDRINLICVRLKEAGIPVQLKTLNDANGQPKYSGIWYDRQFYADPNGNPYVAPYNSNEWASNTDRPDTTVKDENGNEIEDLPDDNTSGIDLENMLIYLPNGSIGVIDNLIYDESSKTYTIDSHDTYNTTNNYYYEWNYHINYTSITYIGQTEEYNKYYEVYYELPDGRDSADLTKEDVEQLNVSVDVIPYDRSYDDTSLRSLYHFDGDTHDASYWNYCTDFTWNKGSSLTYMDSGVFDGSLYLDETEHEFTLTLPGNISAGDFTLQFRYYQSHTAAPQTDSYISFGNSKLFQFNGGSFLDADGEELSVTPVGSWNEIALIREDSRLYYYLNGVCIGSISDVASYGKIIKFHFGAEQQTYKQLDELRVLNYALQTGGDNYECTSVPFDTNLSLVIPGTALPVADEYWAFTSSGTNLLEPDFTSGMIPSTISAGSDNDTNGIHSAAWRSDFPHFNYFPHVTTLMAYPNFLRICNDGTETGWVAETEYRYWLGGLFIDLGTRSELALADGNYVFSVVLADGTVCSLPFSVPLTYGDYGLNIVNQEFDWGELGVSTTDMFGSSGHRGQLYILPELGSSVDIVYAELVSGTSTDLSAEWVETVIGMEPENYNTPTLAVRTDLEITSYQIGGVRPSVPEKGQVWAMVENERITSIQIYNGQAWEACDGRIWTGSRWIPASSYNIITLQDMYDIVDATPDYEYIYSEAGFWAWFQKAWNAFMVKVDQIIILLSGGSLCQHVYTSEIAKDSTCVDEGSVLYTCTLCSNTYTEMIPANGHDWVVTGQGFGGAYVPNYADRIEDCVDTSLEYVLPDGYVYRSTLYIPELYNYEAGLLGYMLSPSDGSVKSEAKSWLSDFIPVDLSVSDPVVLKFLGSFGHRSSGYQHGVIQEIYYYDSNYQYLSTGFQGSEFSLDRNELTVIDGGYLFKVGYQNNSSPGPNGRDKYSFYDQIAYIRFSLMFNYEGDAKVAIDSITQEGTQSVIWENTGIEVSTLLDGYDELTCSVCGATAKDYGLGPDDIVLPEPPDSDYEYIDSEVGFWAWMQRFGQTLMTKIDQLITLLSGGSICQHTYSSEIKQEATCASPGTMLYTCTLCEHTYTEVIPALPHRWTVTGQYLNGMPTVTFVDSIEDCVDTSKDYVLPDGFIYRYTELSAPNLFDPSEVELGRMRNEGDVYDRTDEAYFTTGFIPVDLTVSDNITFYFEGDSFTNSFFVFYIFCYYDSSGNLIGWYSRPYEDTYSIDGGVAADFVRNGSLFVPKATGSHYQSSATIQSRREQVAYVRMTFGLKGAPSSEESTFRARLVAGNYGITSIKSSVGGTYAWVNTGMKADIPVGGYNELVCSACGATAKDFGSGPEQIILPALPEPEPEDTELTILEMLGVLNEGTWKIVVGVVTTAFDGFTSFVSSVGDVGSFFSAYKDTGEGSILLIPLEEGATVWD